MIYRPIFFYMYLFVIPFFCAWTQEEHHYYLKYESIKNMVKELPKDKKFVALTFDDGPSKTNTPLILEVLNSHNIKATFFMLGAKAEKNIALVEQVVEAGHELGNHSYSHSALTRGSLKSVSNELQKTKDILQKYTTNIQWFRPPYGLVNTKIYEKACQMGMNTVLWTVDSKDWRKSTQSVLKQRVLEDIQPGSVILFHDTKEQTALALPDIIKTLQNEGYEFVTMSEWLQRVEETHQGDPVSCPIEPIKKPHLALNLYP